MPVFSEFDSYHRKHRNGREGHPAQPKDGVGRCFEEHLQMADGAHVGDEHLWEKVVMVMTEASMSIVKQHNENPNPNPHPNPVLSRAKNCQKKKKKVGMRRQRRIMLNVKKLPRS